MKKYIIIVTVCISFLSCNDRYIAVYKTEGNKDSLSQYQYLIYNGNWRRIIRDSGVSLDTPVFDDDGDTSLFISQYEYPIKYKMTVVGNKCLISSDRNNVSRTYYSLNKDTIVYHDDLREKGYSFYKKDTSFNLNGKDREAYVFKYGIPKGDARVFPNENDKQTIGYENTRYIDKKLNLIIQDSYGSRSIHLDTIVFSSKKNQKKLLKGIIFKSVSDTIYKNELGKIYYSEQARNYLK